MITIRIINWVPAFSFLRKKDNSKFLYKRTEMHQIHQFKFTIHLGKVQFGVLAIFTSIYFQSLTKNNQNENRFRFQGNDGARYVQL